MTSDSKKPGMAFWATVVVVVALVAYSLSAELRPSGLNAPAQLAYQALSDNGVRAIWRRLTRGAEAGPSADRKLKVLLHG